MREKIEELDETKHHSEEEMEIKINEIVRWINCYVGVDAYSRYVR